MGEALAVICSESPDIQQVSALVAEGLALAMQFQAARIGTCLDAILAAAAPFLDYAAVTDLTESACG
ncbi:hypothetical protein [Frankia sp. EAN1pec]|uniref:hypothetical protein n=1 Tax=Parafrankia sp. (strain EAN1pec) TaxID=298653 RepID=UPI00059DEB2C